MADTDKLAHEIPETPKQINDLEIADEAEIAVTRTQTSVFLKRRRRRRLDLRTLAGTARESAKIYRQFAEGEITGTELELRSRHLRRHSEILTSMEQRVLLESLAQKLEAIRLEQQLPLIDEDVK